MASFSTEVAMKLYSFTGSCGLATNIVLEWIGAPFEVVLLEKPQLKSPEFLSKNPNGQVPMLEDGDFVLTQNAAILGYLTDKHPEAKLCGEGDIKLRAEIHRWLSFINSDVHPTFKPLFGATAFLEDEAVIAKTQDMAKERLHALFTILDQQLAGKKYLTGQRSIADAYLFVTLLWTKFVNVDLSDLQNLAAFQQNMAQDTAVQKALATQKL